MNTKQIAEEAWKCIKNLPEDLQFYDEEGQAIIQAAIEKAMQAWLTSGNPNDYPLPRAAHASELPANPDKDHPERPAPARKTS